MLFHSPPSPKSVAEEEAKSSKNAATEMLVTTAKIRALNPCADRLRAYMKHHAKFKGTMTGFLNLPHITHKDKCWVYFRMIPTEISPQVAADIAESVLHIFEAAHPRDKRPRKAIEAARSGVGCIVAANGAHSASVIAAIASNTSACRAALSAANAAVTPLDHVEAGLFSHSNQGAYAATSAANYACYAADSPKQEALQIEIMKRHLKKRTPKCE